MSYEMAPTRVVKTRTGTKRVYIDDAYTGLGAVGVIALPSAPSTIAAPVAGGWMAGLPKAGDSKDNTRIAYAKRDHDLAMRGDATAYRNLQGQAAGSATAVGKAWYRAALADVDRSRSAPTPPPPVTRIAPPTTVNVNPIPLHMEVLKAGLDVQQQTQANGAPAVVAVNPSTGAVVSSPLPIPVSAVTNPVVLPVNAVQAPAPASALPMPATGDGIFSIFSKMFNSDAENAANAAAQNAAANAAGNSGGGGGFAPAPVASGDPSVAISAPVGGGGLLQNPVVLIGAGLAAILLLRKR